MQQTTGLDQMFMSLDTSTTNAVLGGLVLFEGAAADGRGPDEAFMRARITERLPHLPPLRWQVAKVPFRLDHDYFVEAARVDVGAHLRTVRLPAPGTREQLAAEVSRMMGTSLVPGRPMWDLTIIEGLDDGGMAHLLRIHHGVVDGSSMPVLWDLLADDPTVELTPPERSARFATPVGGSAELLGRGLVGAALRPFRALGFQASLAGWLVGEVRRDGVGSVPALAARLTPGELARPIARLADRMLPADSPAVRSYIPTLAPPRTGFNGRVSAERVFTFADLPLSDFKKVGKTFGVTMNDVVLAVCAGALRRYLADRGEVPTKPLVVCIPVSLRTDEDTGPAWANNVHMIFASLPTHLEDPMERLRAVGADVTEAKQNFDRMPKHLFKAGSRFLPASIFTVPVRVLTKAPDVLSRGPWNVVVSNVRGPAKPTRVGGQQVAGYWPASFLPFGGGINITLQSYVDRVCFGFVGAPEQAGDLWPITKYMSDALDELLAAAGVARPVAATADR